MGGNGAVHDFSAGATEGLGSPPNGRAGRGDIVDQEHGQAAGSSGRGKAAARQFESVGTGVTRLPPQAVPPQEPVMRSFETARNCAGQQLRGRPGAAYASHEVRRDGTDDID